MEDSKMSLAPSNLDTMPANDNTETLPATEDAESIDADLSEFNDAVELAHKEGFSYDFSSTLGEGFDHDFFSDKMGFLPFNKMFDSWNMFLLHEENLEDRTIEFGFLERVFNKITGKADAPLLFPVFIQAVKSYCESKGIPSDHLNPERLQRFYDSVIGSFGGVSESEPEPPPETETPESSPSGTDEPEGAASSFESAVTLPEAANDNDQPRQNVA